MELAMPLSVSVESISSDGTDFTISITQTGPDTAAISITTTESSVSHTDSYNVYDVKASTKALTCTATVLFFHPNLTCAIDGTRPPGAATVSVSVANAPAHNGTTDYQVSNADGLKIVQFLTTANYPPLEPAV